MSSVVLFKDAPNIFSPDLVNLSGSNDLDKLVDGWIHQIELTTGEDKSINISCYSATQNPSIKSVFDKVFSRPSFMRNTLKGSVIKRVEILESIPVTSYKIFITREVVK